MPSPANAREEPSADDKCCRPSRSEIQEIVREVLHVEAQGILHLMDRLDGSMATAVEWILETRGRVIVTGIGKSGIVGRKIVATLSSTGTPALFLHPVEAVHGDLGMVREEDIALALSNSGETDELNAILPSLRAIGARIVAFTGNPKSTLARRADLAVYTGVPREACPLGLAPTASTTAQLAMGDALAVALIRAHNFQARDFCRNHPGGHLGERLKVGVEDIMRLGEAIPAARENVLVPAALEEMDAKGLGCTLVLNAEEELLGIFTDGDLRRAFRRFPSLGEEPVHRVMTPRPRCIPADRSVAEALQLMEEHLITVLPVVDGRSKLRGILHLHDLLGKGRISFTLPG